MNLKRLALLQPALERAVQAREIAGGNILVIHRGKEQGYYEAGFADLENHLPIRRDSLFRLYSMTKPVTAAAMMILMETGLVDLLDPVSRFLPGFQNQKVLLADGSYEPVRREANLHDLLSMSSGLVYGDETTPAGREAQAFFDSVTSRMFTENPCTTYEAANLLGQCGLAFHPGEHWQYGASADVLGAVVEVVTGMRFGDFLEKTIFEPLGMEDTGFGLPPEKRSRLVKAYAAAEGTLTEYTDHHLAIDHDMNWRPAFESGGAGLVSSIDDYAKFTRMLLNRGAAGKQQILAPKTVDYMTSCRLTPSLQQDMDNWPGLEGYSYGNLMRVMTDPGLSILNGTKGEYGWDGWMGVYFFNDPVHKLSFLLMYQKTDSGTTPLTRRLRNLAVAALE